MTLEDKADLQVIREAIKAVLAEHIRRPFNYIREAGLQARIAQKIEARLRPRTVKFVVPETDMSPRKSRPARGRKPTTNRVQLEMHISGEKPSSKTRFDIVVLRSNRPIELTWCTGGAGDVAAKIRPEDVLAAIEVKASPSSHRSQRNAYEKDLTRLAGLVSHEIHGFFVFADKSSGLYRLNPSEVAPPEYWPKGVRINRMAGRASKRQEIIAWRIDWVRDAWVPCHRVIDSLDESNR